MQIVCIAVGKKHDKYIAEAIADYEKRLRRYANFEFSYIPSSETEMESQSILKQIETDDRVFLLDEDGFLADNKQLASEMELAKNQSVKRVVFIIGGAYGVSEIVKLRSDHIISISKLVFPHQLMRLILVEQLYRTFNMLAGGKYHHY